MKHLLRKPEATIGRIQNITPENAGWSYVGFDVYRLATGERAEDICGDNEMILVLVEGRAHISAADKDWGEVGERLSVWERSPPHALYIPNQTSWKAIATTDCVLAVCKAPGQGGHQAQRLGPDGISLEKRGKGNNTRYIHNIAMEGRNVADSLLVTEVFTPNGHWSSFPSHRHDEDNYPHITYLEETYYHRIAPQDGFGIQRVYTEDGSLDETMSVKDHDVVLVPKGHHPCAAPYGIDMYYLNVMAGPLRKWRFQLDPAVAWIVERDS